VKITIEGSLDQVLDAILARKAELEENDSIRVTIEFGSRLEQVTIDQLELGLLAYNGLKNYNVLTVGEINELSDAGILRIPNIGKKSLKEIRDAVKLAQQEVDAGRPLYTYKR
jgi:DNA-directed RNA polymerase alpha subunit